MTKKLIPDDLRDFLSLISLIGFLALFFKFGLDKPFLSEAMDSIFLIVAGVGLMVIGKVFSIGTWVKDGLQKNEVTQLLSLVLGLVMLVIGILMVSGVVLSDRLIGFIGIISLFPAIFIFFDYLAKNDKC